MNPVEAVLAGLRGWNDFDGRSGRSAFWWWYLFEICFGLLLFSVMSLLLGTRAGWVAITLAAVVLLLPRAALTVRRLHDVGRSGVWLVAPYLCYGVALAIIMTAQGVTSLGVVVGLLLVAGGALSVWLLILSVLPSVSNVPSVGGQQQPSATDGPQRSTQALRGRPHAEPSSLSGDPYAIAGRELQTGQREPGAWAQALVLGRGEALKVDAEYVRLRVERLKAEATAAPAPAPGSAHTAPDQSKRPHSPSEVAAYAELQGVPLDDAARMLQFGITRVSEKFVFADYRYDRLDDAIAYATRAVAREAAL